MSVDVAANLVQVQQRIQRACEKAGRAPESVRLLAVAKTQPASRVLEAIEAGQMEIAQNYAQELLEIKPQCPNTVHWHFIGRLQSNKVRQIVGQVELIHSVDRPKLLREIEKRSAALDIVTDCLLEINVGEQESKGGVSEKQAAELLETATGLEHVRVLGLMSIPPFYDDPELIRPFHKRLCLLAEKLRQDSGLALPELSMGMSTDLEAAVEEGATMVRIGTDIFGPRNYHT